MSKKYRFLLFYIIFSGPIYLMAQEKTDTAYTAEEVIVQGYPDKMRLLESPASVGIVDKKQLANQPGFTLVPALNLVSGVRMEERSPGSYRLSVRGSLLRSPFGIRNVKIYIDDFLLTDAGGNSYLNLMDAGAIQKMEILKGPHGSLYGANTGGVAIINPFEKLHDSLQVNAALTYGSYGLFYQKAGMDKQFKKHKLSLYEAYQRSDGYRTNSALERKYIQLGDVFDYHKNMKLKAFAFYSELNYQTPGGLTLQQYEQNPAGARPGTKGAVEQKARIINKTIYGGIAHEAKLYKNLRHVISLFATHTGFENPAIANYEFRNENTVGLRTYLELTGKGENQSRSWKWNTGLEWQRTTSTVTDYGNIYGIKDTLQSSSEINARQYFVFSQFSAHIGRLAIEAGLSFNNYQYQYRSLLITPEPPLSARTFDLQWMPRIALSYGLSQKFFWRGSVSRGYSSPATQELLPSGNVLNATLQPEFGWNYETGLRYQNSRIEMDAVVFYYNLQNAIVSRQNANSTTYYTNAGGTNQFGLEWQCRALLLKPSQGRWINSIELSNSFTWYNFSFSNYKIGTADYSGSRLTGVPQTVVVTGLNTVFAKGLYTYWQYNYTSVIPVNDQNTVYAPEYHLVQVKAGWKHPIKNKYKIDLYGGVDNLLNVQYSLGNDLNAIGNRYYNAAPLRNYYIGAGFSF